MSALAAFVAGGVFAQMPQMSIGAGYIHSAGSVGGMSTSEGSANYALNGRGVQNGGFLFFDATYAELAIGLMNTSAYEKEVGNVRFGNDGIPVVFSDDFTSVEYQGSGLAMDISLLGRYPVPVGKMTISPLLGVGYNMVLSTKGPDGKAVEWDKMGKHANGDARKASDLSTFRIQLGAGADFDVTDQIYIRTQGLAQYRFAAKAYGKKANTPETASASDPDMKFKGGFGGSFTVAVGYKF